MSLLYGNQTKLVCFKNAAFREQKYELEAVSRAKHKPNKNQSESLDLPQDYLAI